MARTLLGMVTLVRLEQLANAYSSISSTESGIITLVNVVHSKNASVIILTESGMVTEEAEPLYFISTPSPTMTNSSFRDVSHGVLENAPVLRWIPQTFV